MPSAQLTPGVETAAGDPLLHSPAQRDVLSTSGQPLDSATRAFFEPRFGHDFSRVRVHSEEEAAESAAVARALAFTVGSQIVFGAGQYRPQSGEGRKLLAHELAHAIQRTSSSVSGEPAIQRQADPDEPDESPPEQELPRGCYLDCQHNCARIAEHFFREKKLVHDRASLSAEVSQCDYHPGWQSGSSPYIWFCVARITEECDGEARTHELTVKLKNDRFLVNYWSWFCEYEFTAGPCPLELTPAGCPQAGLASNPFWCQP